MGHLVDWGPYFDFGAVGLPTILGIIGVAVSFEAPKLENRWAIWGIRGFLIAIGLFASWVTWEQQQLARTEASSQRQHDQASAAAANKAVNTKLDQINGNYEKLVSALKIDPHAPLSDVIARIDKLTAKDEAQEWPPLSPSEIRLLAAHLKEIPSQQIGIACEFPTCAALAQNFADAFKLAQWDVPPVHHGGGFDVDGVVGIGITSCNGSAAQIKERIERFTKLKVNPVNDVPCVPFLPTYLVVGERPF